MFKTIVSFFSLWLLVHGDNSTASEPSIESVNGTIHMVANEVIFELPGGLTSISGLNENFITSESLQVSISDVISQAAMDATAKADAAQAAAIAAAAMDAGAKANTARIEAISEAQTLAATAKSEAIAASAQDAATKIAAATSSILQTAASDASTKAAGAQSAAIAAAAMDAASKANTAKADAISEAQTLAATAKSEAIAASAQDTTTKIATATSSILQTAASDALTKAAGAQSAAIEQATALALSAKNEAISAAASDAATKADAAGAAALSSAMSHAQQLADSGAAAAQTYTDTAVASSQDSVLSQVNPRLTTLEAQDGSLNADLTQLTAMVSNLQTALTTLQDNQLTCPSGTALRSPGNKICMSALHGSNNIYNAITECRKFGGGRVCEHNDFQSLCGLGLNPFAGSSFGWYGEHGVAPGGNWDDEYGTWNRNVCDTNNDGPADHAGESKPFRCCV